MSYDLMVFEGEKAPRPRACLKNRKRRLFTRKGPLSASKILANRKIALRFFP